MPSFNNLKDIENYLKNVCANLILGQLIEK